MPVEKGVYVFLFRHKEIGGQQAHDGADDDGRDIPRDIPHRVHGGFAQAVHDAADVASQIVSDFRQVFLQGRREAVIKIRQACRQLIHFPLHIPPEGGEGGNEARSLRNQPGDQEVSHQDHAREHRDDHDGRPGLSPDPDLLLTEAYQRIGDHGDDPAYRKGHEKAQKPRQ